MGDDHQPTVPVALEQWIRGLDEMEIALGETGRNAVPAIRSRLLEAMAARDRGDRAGTVGAITAAMEQLAAIAERLDPREATAMRMVANRFGSALTRGDLSEARQGLGVMFERSGARERKKSD